MIHYSWKSDFADVYNSKTKTFGTARHLIVTVEQLFKSKEGHFLRLYLLLRDTRFQKHIPQVVMYQAWLSLKAPALAWL